MRAGDAVIVRISSFGDDRHAVREGRALGAVLGDAHDLIGVRRAVGTGRFDGECDHDGGVVRLTRVVEVLKSCVALAFPER